MDETRETNAREIHGRVLGWYLMLCAVYQVCISSFFYYPGILPAPETVFGDWYRSSTWFDFGNPRAVIFDLSRLESLYWILAAWLFAIALAMIAKPGNIIILQTYLVFELTLVGLEGGFFLLSWAFGHFRPDYTIWQDFELQSQMMVAIFSSLLPSLCGLWMMRKTRPIFLKFGRTENRELRTEN